MDVPVRLTCQVMRKWYLAFNVQQSPFMLPSIEKSHVWLSENTVDCTLPYPLLRAPVVRQGAMSEHSSCWLIKTRPGDQIHA